MGIPFIWIIILALFVAIALATYFLTNSSNGGNTPTGVCIEITVNAGNCDTIVEPPETYYVDTESAVPGVTRVYTDAACTSLVPGLSGTIPPVGEAPRVLIVINGEGVLTSADACTPAPPSCTSFNLLDAACGFGIPVTLYALADEITGIPNTQLYIDANCTIGAAGANSAWNDTFTQYNTPGLDGLVTSTTVCF